MSGLAIYRERENGNKSLRSSTLVRLLARLPQLPSTHRRGGLKMHRAIRLPTRFALPRISQTSQWGQQLIRKLSRIDTNRQARMHTV